MSQCKRLFQKECPRRYRISRGTHTTLARSSPYRELKRVGATMRKGTLYFPAQFCSSDSIVEESDINTVKHFLCMSNPATIADRILLDRFDWSPEALSANESIRNAFVHKIRSALSLMQHIEESSISDSLHIVVPWQWPNLSDKEKESNCFIGAALVNLENSKVTDISSLSSMSWTDMLSYRMWLPNNLSCIDSVAVISYVFWCITHDGFGSDLTELIRAVI